MTSRIWLSLPLLALLAAAPDPILARSGDITVTAGQLQVLLAALPADTRAKAAVDPASLAELLRDAVLQQQLMQNAHAQGWDRRPDVAAQAERARQAVIVRSYVESQVPAPAAPTDAAVQAAYDANKARFMLPRQYHLAQIFVAVPAGADAETARGKLAVLRGSLLHDPAGFGAAAKRVSDDKRSATLGGDLGWLREDALMEPIKGAVAGMQEGGISDPLRTPDGWHLVQLVATKPAGPATLDQVRPSLVQALDQQQHQLDTQHYLDTTLQHSPVQVNEIALDQIAKTAAGQ